MLKFRNLKTKDFSPFYLNETDEYLDIYLRSYFFDYNAILSYIVLNEENKYVKIIKNDFNIENDLQIIIMILFNSSINSIGSEIYSALEFKNDKFNNIYKEVFMTFDKEDLFDSITKILFEIVKENINNKFNLSIYDFLRKL